MFKDELIELIMKGIESQKDVINDIDNQVMIEINHDINSNLYVI
ncbi:hypothetical protein [Macrococcoides canis]|nr:hypothetical protein [Macrococcus canis]